MNIEVLFPNGVWPYLAGGVCIGLAVSLIFVLTGQVAGMSSVFSSCWSWFSRRAYFQQPRLVESRVWRLWLAVGLIGGAALYWFGVGPGIAWHTQVPLWQLGLGGFIAGFGARLGNGCTSGHGICGMASLNGVSFLSVMVFLSVAILTANLVAVYGGGQ